MSATLRKKRAARQKRFFQEARRIKKRLANTPGPERAVPMMTASNIHYEASGRVRGFSHGGIGAIHTLARQLGLNALGSECHACRIRRICGGGLYAHRYRAGTGFANPSVYCPDLMRLITHIWTAMEADIESRLGGPVT